MSKSKLDLARQAAKADPLMSPREWSEARVQAELAWLNWSMWRKQSNGSH